MSERFVIRFHKPVNESSIGQLTSYPEPTLMELVKSLRVDMENCAIEVIRSSRAAERTDR